MTNFLKISMSSGVIALSLILTGCQSAGGPLITEDLITVVDDQSDLSVRVKRALKAAPQTAVNQIMVTKVGDDTVKLSGYVLNDATSHEAERVAGQVEGVRHVFNSLVVQ